MTRRFFLLWTTLLALFGFKPKEPKKLKVTTTTTGMDYALGEDMTIVTIIGVDQNGKHVREQHTIPAGGGSIESKHIFKKMPKFEVISSAPPNKHAGISMGVFKG